MVAFLRELPPGRCFARALNIACILASRSFGPSPNSIKNCFVRDSLQCGVAENSPFFFPLCRRSLPRFFIGGARSHTRAPVHSRFLMTDEKTVGSKRRGAFILFEGLDRSGKSTQSKLLAKTLNETGTSARWMCFPGHFSALDSLDALASLMISLTGVIRPHDADWQVVGWVPA